MSIDVAKYMQPSPLCPRAMELTPAGELLADELSARIAQIWRDIVETDEPEGELTKGLIKKQAELERLYVALTEHTVPGAHGLTFERRVG